MRPTASDPPICRPARSPLQKYLCGNHPRIVLARTLASFFRLHGHSLLSPLARSLQLRFLPVVPSICSVRAHCVDRVSRHDRRSVVRRQPFSPSWSRRTRYMSPLEKWKSEKRRPSKAAAARTTLMTISYRALSFMRYVMALQFMKTFTLGLSSGRARRLDWNKRGRDKSQLITLLPLVITASTSTYKLTITCRN